MTGNARLRHAWTDDPGDPARPEPGHPDVQALLGRIAPGEEVMPLGGTMSLNLHLVTSGRVLRVHQPFVSMKRVQSEQEIRRFLSRSGIDTAVPLANAGATILRCGTRLAEIEPFIEGTKPPATVDAYAWLFTELGVLHRVLAGYETPLTRAVAATWAPPGSLARWLRVTIPAISITPDGAAAAARLAALANAVRRLWWLPEALPNQVVHGDARLGNFVRTENGRTVIFDLGFATHRPRIYDVAYSLAFMVLALGPVSVDAALVMRMVRHYEAGAGWSSGLDERRAIAGYAASAMLYAAAHDGFVADPLKSFPGRRSFLDVAAWFIDQAKDLTSE